MNLRRFYILALVLSGFAVVVWLVVPTPKEVRSLSVAQESWKLPTQPVFNTKDILATLNSAGLWGKLAEIVQPSDIEPEWRFIGAMGRGQERQVIIKKTNQPEQILVPGDSLPGGSKILSIDNDRICLLINGQKRSLYIYPHGRLSEKMSSQVEEEAPIRQAVSQATRRNR